MKSIIIPGDEVPEGARIPSASSEKGRTATVVALYDSSNGNAIALEDIWSPKSDDVAIGIVKSIRNKVCSVDLSYFGEGLIIERGYERSSLEEGEAIEAKVKAIEDRKTVILQYPKLLIGGIIIKIKPTKIARLIGKGNTMINMITELTKSRIVVGNNGLIWIKGGDVPLAIKAISKIEEEAHTSGLTERIKEMLLKEAKDEKTV